MLEKLNFDKKTMIMAGIIGFIIIFVVIIISVVVNMLKPTYYTYEELENLLIENTKKYYNINKSFLPTEENTSTTLNYSALVTAELMKPLEEILERPNGCSADIVVTRTGEDYTYMPYLNCPDYKTIELYKIITDENSVVSDGRGIYKEKNGEYIFKGEATNNYIMINERLWRIMGVDKDNNIKVISGFKTGKYVWDDRYNTEKKTNFGKNDFEISRLKDYLISLYNTNEFFTQKEKALLVPKKMCIGTRKATDKAKDNSIECKKTSADEYYLGLPTPSDFLIVSLDPKCKKTNDKPCVNYNYLTQSDYHTWTPTKSNVNSYTVYYISSGGVYENRASSLAYLRVVSYLGTKALYKSGIGTATDPYILR